jgi:hypothetical protein
VRLWRCREGSIDQLHDNCSPKDPIQFSPARHTSAALAHIVANLLCNNQTSSFVHAFHPPAKAISPHSRYFPLPLGIHNKARRCVGSLEGGCITLSTRPPPSFFTAAKYLNSGSPIIWVMQVSCWFPSVTYISTACPRLPRYYLAAVTPTRPQGPFSHSRTLLADLANTLGIQHCVPICS